MVGKKKKNLNGFTSDAVAITVVNLFDGSIPEGKLPHPVNSAANTRRQAQAGIGSGRVKAVRPEIVITYDEKKEKLNGMLLNERRMMLIFNTLPKVLAIIVWGHVVDMDLITFLSQ